MVADLAQARPVPEEVDVTIVGAGPTGLIVANLLGLEGVSVAVLEQRERLIDYPRGIGMDDETLRVLQAAGVVDDVLPHTVPNQRLSYVTATGRVLATFGPAADDFGWPRKLGFLQPHVDEEIFSGLDRFPHANVHFQQCMDGYTEDADVVRVRTTDRTGTQREIRARYLVGCDGGRSLTRKSMGVDFEGITEPTRWLVVDLENDPIGTPNAVVFRDPRRPYVSAGLPYGVRRFEFMLFDHEGHDGDEDELLRRLLGSVLTDPASAEVIQSRVYTHHARVASSFRRGRIMIAGDAAHLMPVWQGQGYNTGVRDAGNLGWKLAAVCNGQARPELLDTYDAERRPHAKSMVDLSRASGQFLGVRNRFLAGVRDAITLAAGSIPAVRDYFVQMRFKPMPTYTTGAVAADANHKHSPVGTLFVQPDVQVEGRVDAQKLDDAIGNRVAILRWGADPRRALSEQEVAFWRGHRARFLEIRPSNQLRDADDPGDAEHLVVGDRDRKLRAWFNQHPYGIVFLRPDRIVAAACQPQQAPATSRNLAAKMAFHDEGGVAAGRRSTAQHA